jgi:hypothetical protein
MWAIILLLLVLLLAGLALVVPGRKRRIEGDPDLGRRRPGDGLR